MQNKIEENGGRWVEWNTDTWDTKAITQWDYNHLTVDCYDWAINTLLDLGLRFKRRR